MTLAYLRPALPLVVLLACSENMPNDTPPAGTTGTDGDTDGVSSTGGEPPTTTNPDPSTDPGDPTGDPPDPATTDAPGTVSDSDGTTTDLPGTITLPETTDDTGVETVADTTADTGTDATTDGPPGDDEYAAFYIPGGLDRIAVRKSDPVADLCTTMIFVWPGGDFPARGYAVDLPDMWGVQGGMIHQGVGDCLQFMGFPDMAEMAIGGDGSAAWMVNPNEFCPKTLDIDLKLHFMSQLPWVPDEDILQADAIPVQGC